MSDEPNQQLSEADARLEREIRRDRKFSLSEAIGRLAGPGIMKGASPVARREQAAAEIEYYLRAHLSDSAGVLRVPLLRRVAGSDLLLNNLNQPLVVLAACVQRILDSEYHLKELVREADVEWGTVFCERPHFDAEGCPPQPDDPYTFDSVRAALSELLKKLAPGEP
jgi:hypothetical protein